MAEAAEYKGPGPHTMAVFVAEYTTDTGLPTLHRFQQMRFPGTETVTGSHDAAGVELLVCGEGSKGTRRIGSCQYSSLGIRTETYPLYTQTYDYTVYELSTGKVVRTLRSVDGTGARSCPYRLNGSVTGEEPTKVYARADTDRAEDLLRELVTGPAR